jgi:hypothetical protein
MALHVATHLFIDMSGHAGEAEMQILITLSLAKAYRDTLVEAATSDPESKAVGSTRPRLQQRLLVRLGKWLIATGLRLRARYGAASHPFSDHCSPADGRACA